MKRKIEVVEAALFIRECVISGMLDGGTDGILNSVCRTDRSESGMNSVGDRVEGFTIDRADSSQE